MRWTLYNADRQKKLKRTLPLATYLQECWVSNITHGKASGLSRGISPHLSNSPTMAVLGSTALASTGTFDGPMSIWMPGRPSRITSCRPARKHNFRSCRPRQRLSTTCTPVFPSRRLSSAANCLLQIRSVANFCPIPTYERAAHAHIAGVCLLSPGI